MVCSSSLLHVWKTFTNHPLPEIEIPENWEETATTVPTDDPEAIAKAFFEQLAKDDEPETHEAVQRGGNAITKMALEFDSI